VVVSTFSTPPFGEANPNEAATEESTASQHEGVIHNMPPFDPFSMESKGAPEADRNEHTSTRTGRVILPRTDEPGLDTVSGSMSHL
jgi:hypothetical protein